MKNGITLIALIITIIVLVILAAVTLNSIFGSNIIGIATNGAINYAEEQQKELGMLNDVSDMLGRSARLSYVSYYYFIWYKGE